MYVVYWERNTCVFVLPLTAHTHTHTCPIYCCFCYARLSSTFRFAIQFEWQLFECLHFQISLLFLWKLHKLKVKYLVSHLSTYSIHAHIQPHTHTLAHTHLGSQHLTTCFSVVLGLTRALCFGYLKAVHWPLNVRFRQQRRCCWRWWWWCCVDNNDALFPHEFFMRFCLPHAAIWGSRLTNRIEHLLPVGPADRENQRKTHTKISHYSIRSERAGALMGS